MEQQTEENFGLFFQHAAVLKVWVSHMLESYDFSHC